MNETARGACQVLRELIDGGRPAPPMLGSFILLNACWILYVVY
jgi:hypothetical protein